MEKLTPSLRLLFAVRHEMECGQSVRQGIYRFLEMPADSLSVLVRQWLHLFERGACTEEFLSKIENPVRRQILMVLENGLRGEPILAHLSGLSDEVQERSLGEIELFLARLPFRMMLPLLFFLFPAFLLLLLGPLLLRVVAGLV